MGYVPVIKAMCWQQGENDAAKVETAKAYAQNLSNFIKRVRKQYAPKMLFIYGYVLPPPNDYAGREYVRNAERDIDEASGSGLAVKGAHVVPTDDLDRRADDPGTPYPNDRLHFGTQGIWELGARMADTIYKYSRK